MEQEKRVWSFTNILAYSIFLMGFGYLFVVAFALSKNDVNNNNMLSQITTGVLALMTLTAAFYFGSSMGQAKQQAQITEMSKTATDLASKTADVAIANAAGTGSISDVKADKLTKIGELKAKLDGLDPESEDAKTILEELKELEKQSS